MANKTKFFRVCVEGATTDGRTIARQDIAEMAETYNPDTYGARVNLEHWRGIMPDGPFKAYGDVLAVKAEQIEILGQKRLALFAQIDPTDDLVAYNKKRQKIFTSCEVQRNFAESGKAYLVGLAVTDSPASLGTEMLKFAAGQGEASPLAARKQDPGNEFTEATEVTIELEAETPAEPSLLDKVKQLLTGNKSSHDKALADARAAVELLATQQAKASEALATTQAALDQLSTQHTELKTAFDALSAKLDSTPATKPSGLPPATGGDPDDAANKTDC